MNKKILLMSGVLLTLGIIITIPFINNNKNIKSNIAENDTNEINNDMLTLMYETGIDTNEYEISTSNTWPDDNYIFNKELSGCENSGELSWNQQTNKITLLNNTSDRCYIYFDVYNKAVINNVTSSVTTNSITVNVSTIVGENPISKYYYSINDGGYIESSYNSYTFNNLNDDTSYIIKIFVEDTLEIQSNVYTINAETESVTYICDNGTNMATCIKNQYTSQGSNGLYYHTSSLANSASDNSYRYAGTNPNNYVCFGSEKNVCSEDNLYRIIGVFGDQVKLIKNTSLGNYYWSGSSSNDSGTWSSSTLNTETLNGTYLKSLGSNWSNLIATHSWKVGGGTRANLAFGPNGVPKNAYNYEVGYNSSNITYSSKVGLIYVSDYYYGASPTYWTYPGYTYSGATDLNGNYGSSYDYRSAKSSNWLNANITEWTITPFSGNSSFVFYLSSDGHVAGVSGNQSTRPVRPVFYLNSDAIYVSGSGTGSDPIRIN